MYFNASDDEPKEAFVYQFKNTDKPEEIDAAQKVYLPRLNFSEDFDILPSTTKLVFLSKELVDGELPATGSPSVTFPETWSKILILAFIDVENTTLSIKLKAINASPDVFDNGETYFVNLTSNYVYGMFGRDEVMVKPGKTAISRNPADDKKSIFIKLDLRSQKTEKGRTFIRQMTRDEPLFRRVIFIYPKNNKGSVTYHTSILRNL